MRFRLPPSGRLRRRPGAAPGSGFVSVHLFLGYCSALFIASIIPGPAMLLALSTGNRAGLRAGMLAAAGNVAASLIQAAVALLVIMEIGGFSPLLLAGLRYAGAAYIIYLGVTLFRAHALAPPNGADAAAGGPAGRKDASFRDGFAFALFNPKALTFFAALFPQFIEAGQASSAGGILAVLAPVAVIAFLCFMAYVLAGRTLYRALGASRLVGRVVGTAIVATGLAMAWG